MDRGYTYYRFPVGQVIVRRKGNIIEKKGKKGIWEDAPDLLWRFVAEDSALIELSPEEAADLPGKEPEREF